MVLLSVAWLSLTAAPPTLCVRVDSEVSTLVSPRQLVPALAARIGRRQLQVNTCSASTSAQWHLLVKRDGPARLVLVLDGAEVRWSQPYDTTGQTPAEIVPGLALKAAEAVRPSVDGLLAQLGLLEEPNPAAPSSLATLEALENQPTAVAIADLPQPGQNPPLPHLDVELNLGGTAGPALPIFHATAEVAVGVGLGRWVLVAFGTAALPAHVSRDGVQVTATTFGAGAGLDWAFERVAFGLRFGARHQLAQVASSTPTVVAMARGSWAFTGSLRFAWWPVRLGLFEAGVVALGTVLVPPQEYLVRGEVLATQGWVEGALQLGARVALR